MRRYVEERNVDSIEDLIKVYNEVKSKMGYFVMIGVPIPDDQRINFRSMLWINAAVQQPNVVVEYKISRFCSEAYHRFIQTFLEKFTFATHLFLMDADEIPTRNDILQLMVSADKDVVVGPTPIVKSNKGICWNINKYVEGTPPYDIDFIRWTELPDKLFRVNYSGGPWLIKRKVLEKLKWPYFKDVFVETNRQIGQDVYFDISVDEAGFEIWCEPNAKFEHYRPTNLNIAMDEFFKYEETYGFVWGDMAIFKNDWEFIQKIIKENNLKNVLEFGSGLSSLLISDLIKIDSFETDKKYADLINQKRKNQNLNIYLWDGEHFNSQPKYDLAFVDGPLSKLYGGLGRQFSIKAASEHSDRVLVHNANREGEEKWQEKYLKLNFDLINSYGIGTKGGLCNYWVRKNIEKKENK